MTTPSRLIASAVACAALIAVIGGTWEIVRFGITGRTTAARVEREVRDTVAERVSEVERLSQRVANEGQLVLDAATSRDRLPALFDRLLTLAEPVDQHGVAATIYVPTGTPGSYRVLAWSNGPGEKNLAAERLSGPAALFVAPGHAGLRLVSLHPVEVAGRRVGMAVAETVLATGTPTTEAPERHLPTSFGPVSVVEQYASAREELPSRTSFVVTSSAGAPLLEVHIREAELQQQRRAFRRRAVAASLLPLVALLAGAAVTLAVRRRGRALGQWVRGSALAALPVCAAAAALIALARLANWSSAWPPLILAAALLALVALVPAGLWWRGWRRRTVRAAPVAFAVEQLLAGLALAVAIEAIARLLDRATTLEVLERGQFVLFPFDAGGALTLGTLLLTEVSSAWAAVSLLAVSAVRWHLPRWRAAMLTAVVLWLAPVALGLAFLPAATAGRAVGASAAAAGVAAAFAVFAVAARHAYRRASQALRLLLAFAALVAPLVVLYPMAATTADQLTRDVIAHQYAPAIARQPQELRALVARAQSDIDRMATLDGLVSAPASLPTDTQAAFLIWSQTGLSQARVISDVELYGPQGSLVSRFAFNYVYRTNLQTWQGRACNWEVFGEGPFGAEERLMLHAERGVCDAQGRLLGGIVIHVASNDYQALPFLSSPNPYYELLGVADDGAATMPRLPGLMVGVYGWGHQPLYTSGQLPWAVSEATFDRLYRTGEPFWMTVPTADGTHQVHFSQNRVGLYALAYPEPTLVDHATRLAEIIALAGLAFVLLQAAALLTVPLTRHRQAPLRVLFHEIRTSFYRKLFLVFVAVAVVPVLTSALAFDAYMASRFQADVESEAARTMTVAKRMFEQLVAPGGSRGPESLAPPSDDVMVWIRDVISQDVNLYEASELAATSQRDLFDSGLLPTRTPALVYRAIALERRATFLAEDRIGASPYLVAATPVMARGRDSVLTVPLASRQRENQREIDTLNRRVLVGAVLVLLLAAMVGASLAGRIADPVARLTRATRQIAAGRLGVRVAVNTADELQRLVDDFNSMAGTLEAQQAELARANQLKAWNEMARQVAHEIKNPLTPIQLSAEHLQHVHEDRGRPLGTILDQCVKTILGQVRLLRQIASEFSSFAGEHTLRRELVSPAALLAAVIDPYRLGLAGRVTFEVDVPDTLPALWVDRTLLSRALTNLVENAVQAMPEGGTLRVRASATPTEVVIAVADTGVGMDATALARAFEPYFSTKTGGSGLGLANARRHVELHGGTVSIVSAAGRGTTITLVLPRGAAPHDSSADAAAPSR